MEKTYTQMQEQKSQLEVMAFTDDLFGSVRAVKVEEKIWFIGRDVVEDLGYSVETKSYTHYIKKYCDEDDCIFIDKTQYQNGIEFDYKILGQRGGYFINEYAVIDLILHSQLPQAKQFKRWITHVVIPQIRRTGGYIPVNVSDTQETIEQRAKEIASKTIAIKDELIAQQQAMIEQQQQEIAELQEENEVKESEVVLFMNDVRYLFNRTDYGCHSISEAFELVTGNVNGKRRFVKWFKENNDGYVDVLDSYVDERGSKIVNAIDLTEINTFHRFKDLCFDFLKQESKDIR